jgi:hypothetical protein
MPTATVTSPKRNTSIRSKASCGKVYEAEIGKCCPYIIISLAEGYGDRCMTWKVRIIGNQHDIEELKKSFSNKDISVTKENDEYYLVRPEKCGLHPA